MNHSFFIYLLGIGLLILGSLQAKGEPEEEIETRISVVAIGDPPLPGYEMRGGLRHVFDTPVSEHPPSVIYVRQKGGDNGPFKPVSLGMNIPTGYITYRGERKLVLYGEGKDAEKSEFASIEIPELRDDLTIMFVRDHVSKSWDKAPRIHAFDNSLVAFPNDSVRVINLSRVPIRASINQDHVFQLAVGRSKVIRIPRVDQGILSYAAVAVVGKELLPLIDTATTTMPDTRFNLVIYDSDGAHARKPVNLTFYFERPPEVVPDPPAKDQIHQ